MMTNFVNLRRRFALIAVASVSLLGGSLGFASQAQAAPENLGTITWDGANWVGTGNTQITLPNVDVGDTFNFQYTGGGPHVAHIVDGGAEVTGANGTSCSTPQADCRVGFGINTRTITVVNLSGGGTLSVKGVGGAFALIGTITLVPSGGGGGGSGGGAQPQLGIVPLVTYSLNTEGGACIVDGARIESGSKHYALGYTYVPGADECSRAGFTFVGWARASAPTVPLDLPLLRVWDSTIWRYFIADSYDLVAVWKAVS